MRSKNLIFFFIVNLHKNFFKLSENSGEKMISNHKKIEISGQGLIEIIDVNRD